MQIILLIVGMIMIYYAKPLIYRIDKILIRKDSNEILPYVMYVLAFSYLSFTHNVFDILVYLFIFLILYYVSLIDKEIGIIPETYNIAILLIAILKIVATKPSFVTVAYSAMPIVLLGFIVFIYESVIGDEAMGGGDLKLLFFLSLALGLENILYLLFLSNLFFILRRKGKELYPFGPYIYRAYIGIFFLNELFLRILIY